MAVHPFARNCERIIDYLRDILANLKKAKKVVKEKAPEKNRKQSIDFFGIRPLLLLGSPQMEQQGQVTGSTAGLGGDINNNAPKKKPVPRKTGDPQLDRLLQAYNDAMEKCRKKNVEENASYYRCRARKDGTAKKCQSEFVPMRCPEGVAAREALDAYSKARYADADNGNSGGGGGGGF